VLTSAAGGKKKRSGNRRGRMRKLGEREREKHSTFLCPAAPLFSFNFAAIITWMVSF